MLCALATLCVFASAETVDVNKPLEGETHLQGADAEKALNELAQRFKDNPRVKAHLVRESEDLAGTRKDTGDLLLDRNGRVLQKFGGPKAKMVLLSGTELHEYSASRKTEYVKDFSKAPDSLKLLKSAVTVDLKELAQLFDIAAYTRADGSMRIVFVPRADAKNPLGYQYIQARIGSKELFFNEIEYMPDSGKIVERYSDIQPVAKFEDNDFVLTLPADVKQKVEQVSAEGK